MKRFSLILFSISMLLLLLNMVFIRVVSPSPEQQARQRLFEAGLDIYAYRAKTGSWPVSLRQAWENSPVDHKSPWNEYAFDPWNNPIEYRIANETSALLTIWRQPVEGIAMNMDLAYFMERRLSTDDPDYHSWFPLTNSTHDAEF